MQEQQKSPLTEPGLCAPAGSNPHLLRQTRNFAAGPVRPGNYTQNTVMDFISRAFMLLIDGIGGERQEKGGTGGGDMQTSTAKGTRVC